MSKKEQKEQVDIMVNNEMLPLDKDKFDPYVEELMRGQHAIACFRDELEERGLAVPADFRFKALNKESIDAANSAVFALLGGVPSYVYWASQNKSKFYSNFMKSADSGPQVQVNANAITVVSDLPYTELDTVELDSLGRIVGSPDDEDF
jgi:hypothetical protein